MTDYRRPRQRQSSTSVNSDSMDSWKHDKFDPVKQQTKTTQEIISDYGYNIRELTPTSHIKQQQSRKKRFHIKELLDLEPTSRQDSSDDTEQVTNRKTTKTIRNVEVGKRSAFNHQHNQNKHTTIVDPIRVTMQPIDNPICSSIGNVDAIAQPTNVMVEHSVPEIQKCIKSSPQHNTHLKQLGTELVNVTNCGMDQYSDAVMDDSDITTIGHNSPSMNDDKLDNGVAGPVDHLQLPSKGRGRGRRAKVNALRAKGFGAKWKLIDG